MSTGNMDRILRLMAEKGASDCYLSANSPVLIKLNGQVVQLSDQALSPTQPRQLVAEVLSPSNRPPEMDRKLRAYQAVPTLADILLVGQDEHRVEHWTRDADGVWTARIVEGAAATLRLARFDAAWSLEALYGDV